MRKKHVEQTKYFERYISDGKVNVHSMFSKKLSNEAKFNERLLPKGW